MSASVLPVCASLGQWLISEFPSLWKWFLKCLSPHVASLRFSANFHFCPLFHVNKRDFPGPGRPSHLPRQHLFLDRNSASLVFSLWCVWCQHVPARGQRSTLTINPQDASLYCVWRQCLSPNLGLIAVARWANQWASEIHPSPPLKSWDCPCTPSYPLMWVLKIELTSSWLSGQHFAK